MTRDQARQMRKLLEKQTESMTDDEIINYPAFVEKWKAGTNYAVDKRVEYNGVIYKVLQAHTSQADWLPTAAPSLFSEVLPGQGGTDIGEWEQPDSTNPYQNGDKVTHNGKTWESTADNNVWEPGVYGWAEV